ncbi:TolC family outer membrane protein [Rosenbergiella collisarenosi]|uniref:TolC family outer membrane protein n=1 Tax=Rosenbergiella collisarenosi TaxID=1544695 RepID=UPI001F4FF637|nr:TolC family outer membrane protein [Rosenbergiella collisarenosi]
MMTKMRKKILFYSLAIVIFNVHSSYAITLEQIYSVALQNDSTFKSAMMLHAADVEEKNISKAELFPHVKLDYQNSPHNTQHREYQQQTLDNKTKNISQKEKYNSSSASITVTQTLFDYGAYENYKSSTLKSLMADEKYRNDLEVLFLRITEDYLDILNKGDKLDQINKQLSTYYSLIKINKALFSAGEGSSADVAETQSMISQSEVKKISAQVDLEESETKLSRELKVQHINYSTLAKFDKKKFNQIMISPNEITRWEQLTLAGNHNIASANLNSEAMRYKVRQSYSGYLPTIQLYASHSLNDSNTETTVNQKYDTNSIGIQISMQLYNGGGTSAETRRSEALYEKAVYDKDSETVDALTRLHKNFIYVANSHLIFKQASLAVKAAEDQLTAMKASYKEGQKDNSDLLNAVQQVYNAEVTEKDAIYRYFNSYLAILYSAGKLDENSTHYISSSFR